MTPAELDQLRSRLAERIQRACLYGRSHRGRDGRVEEVKGRTRVKPELQRAAGKGPDGSAA